MATVEEQLGINAADPAVASVVATAVSQLAQIIHDGVDNAATITPEGRAVSNAITKALEPLLP